MDEQSIIVRDGTKIFNNTFAAGVSERVFYNKHYNNPYKIAKPVHIMYENGMPIGMNAFMGMFILDNIKHEKHYVAQSNDSAVIPESRGKHVFSRIVSEFEKNGLECEYIIGIPNDNSHQGFLKMGWMDMAELRTLSMTRNKITLINQPRSIRYKRSKVNSVKKALSNDISFTEEELVVINNSSDSLSQKTNEYYKWKMSNRKGCLLKYHINNRFVGHILFHVIRRKKYCINYNQISIDDWYYEDSSILKEMIKDVKKLGYYIFVPVVNRVNKEYNDFINCGLVDDAYSFS